MRDIMFMVCNERDYQLGSAFIYISLLITSNVIIICQEENLSFSKKVK